MYRFFKIVIALLLLSISINIQSQDSWVLSSNDIKPVNYYGITSANGMIGLVSAPEPLKIKQVVLAGLYDQYGRGRVSNFIPTFNLLNLRLSLNGRIITAQNITNFKQELNMQNGAFTNSFEVDKLAKIKYTYLALRHLPYSVLATVEILPLSDLALTAVNVLETPEALRDSRFTFNEINRKHIGIQMLTSQAETPTGKLAVVATTSFAFIEKRGDEPDVIHEMPDSHLHQQRFSKTLRAGENYKFSLIGTTISSAHTTDAYNEAERLTVFARLEGVERLMELHNKAWAKLWESDIRIEGDAQAQQDIRSMLYHIYAFNSTNSGFSVSPMGLSGLGYNGHVFWDAETWIFPTLLLLQPDMARNMLDYRYKRLQAACNNAFAHGYRGAMFPWESADSGVEETPVWALAGPFEHHISACISIAAWQYFCVTQDVEWLRTIGWPLISETADFWVSRVEKNNRGEYEIRNVVAADEYAENVDNDAYTNAAVKISLQNAQIAATILKLKTNPMWKPIAEKLVINKFPDGTTREHNTYNGENIKQADVNLLAYPLLLIKDTAQIHRDLKFYEQRVPEKNTPAMTQAVFSLLYSRLGKKDKAYFFFKDAYVPNQLPPFGVVAETKGGDNPYFLTGSGGVLQTVMMGFGGLEITSKGVEQRQSTMPSHWKSLTITGVGKNKSTVIIK